MRCTTILIGAMAWWAAATACAAPTGVAAGDDSQPALRQVIAWQIALDRVAFSPGIIDGQAGPKTVLATREFQRVHALPITGKLDPQTARALKLAPGDAMTTYAIQDGDLAEIGPAPREWIARSRLKRLAYESLEDSLAERFHCTRALLARLNPGKQFSRMKPGDKIVAPAVGEDPQPIVAQVIEVALSEKVIRVIDREKRLVALFHCSIAAKKSKRPQGQARVTVITMNPTYSFDPKDWPEVKGIDHKLLIPAGPRCPVGRCWIGLNLPGYGIHGTPWPELIGKTGSHGCFRLTNWDVVRLSRMIRPGTPVKFSP